MTQKKHASRNLNRAPHSNCRKMNMLRHGHLRMTSQSKWVGGLVGFLLSVSVSTRCGGESNRDYRTHFPLGYQISIKFLIKFQRPAKCGVVECWWGGNSCWRCRRPVRGHFVQDLPRWCKVLFFYRNATAAAAASVVLLPTPRNASHRLWWRTASPRQITLRGEQCFVSRP